MQQNYFAQGPGKILFEDRAYIAFPAKRPFPDGTFERRPGRFGGPSFIAASESTGARLSASYDPYDARGGFNLARPDGTSLHSDAAFAEDALLVYPPDDLEGWIGRREIDGALIAASGSFCHRVKLLRPEHAAIRDAIWQEYLQENPHVAAAIGQD